MNAQPSSDTLLRQALLDIGIQSACTIEGSTGHCRTFAIPDHDLFVRIGQPGTEEQARNGVRFATELSKISGHILPPAYVGIAQPLIYAGTPLTFWPLLHEQHVPKTADHYRTFGSILRHIHTLAIHDTSITFRHRRTSTSIARQRIERLARSRYCDQRILQQCKSIFDEINFLLEGISPEIEPSIIHGDAYPQNIVVDHADKPYLIDYDAAGIGISLWDLAPMSVMHKRLEVTDADLQNFLEGYGTAEYLEDPNFKKIVRVRELGIVTPLIAKAATSAIYARELAFRIDSLHDPTVRWTPMANLAIQANERRGNYGKTCC